MRALSARIVLFFPKLFTNTYIIMKELINMFVEDYRQEDFTWKEWTTAAVVCIALVAIMSIAGTIETT